MPSFGVVVFNDDGKILLRRVSGAYGGVEWSFAKGQPDPREKPEQTALREAREELGYIVKIYRPIGMFPSANGYQNHYFLAKAVAGPFPHDFETAEVRWVSVNEARKLLRQSGEKHGNWPVVRRDLAVLEAALSMVQPSRKRTALGVVEYGPAGVIPNESQVDYAQGGNEGGWFTGSDGIKRYIKYPNNPQQSIVECLSNHLYRDLGIYVPQCFIFETEDSDGEQTIGYASIQIPGYRPLYRPTKAQSEDFMRGFAVDILTANWDGAGHNLGLDENGKVVRIDQGGSLIFRAMGELKPDRAILNVTENRTYFTSPFYKSLLASAGMQSWSDTGPFVNPMIDKIAALRDRYGGWRNYVDQNAPMLSASLRDLTTRMLEYRTDWLLANRPKG